MINMLLNASITGGIVIWLWCLSYPLSKKYFKASWHYTVLKITMIFMLFPTGIFAPIFNNIFDGMSVKSDLPYISEQIQRITIDVEAINSLNSALANYTFTKPPQTDKTDNVIEQPDDIKSTSQKIPYLQIIWLSVAVILFSNGIRKIHRFRKQILRGSNGDVDFETQALFLQCKEHLKVRSRIALRTSKYIKTPLAFGVIRPLVIYPETDMSWDEKRLAFIHELTHIKNGDLWLKSVASIISAVHWFNPLAHLLRRKISVVSEEYCDECVVRTMTREERFVYGNLILKVIADISTPQSEYCSTLSASTKNLKRRLFNMINQKKSRKSMIALSVITALIICSFATVYAFAANTNSNTNINEANTTGNINSEEISKDSDITVSSAPIYPVDLEYFKDWEGWEKEWEKYEEHMQEIRNLYFEELEKELKELKKLEQTEEYERLQKKFEASKKSLEESIKLSKSPIYWNIQLWKRVEHNGAVMFKLKNGTEIETDGNFFTKQDWYAFNLTQIVESTKAAELVKYVSAEEVENILEHLKSVVSKSFVVKNNIKPSSSPGNGIALMIPMKKSIIRLANGTEIVLPGGTLFTVNAIANTDHEMEVIVGVGEATITQTDGTSTTVPAGTVLDGDGNIIE